MWLSAEPNCVTKNNFSRVSALRLPGTLFRHEGQAVLHEGRSVSDRRYQPPHRRTAVPDMSKQFTFDGAGRTFTALAYAELERLPGARRHMGSPRRAGRLTPRN